LDVELTAVDIDETPNASTPVSEVAQEIAERKADAWAGHLQEDQILITADTVVVLNGILLGKPTDKEDAKRMLHELSGRTHRVITGVCLRSKSNRVSFSETTEVHFKTLSENEIEYYVDVFRPFDKAGSYGVQEYIGYIGVEHLNGSFYNVMGLPMHGVYKALCSMTAL
jgi:septum formation protein